MSMHINAKPGEIAKKILLPGDPLRAKYVAENYLKDAKLVNEVRGALCYTGTYNGVEVSVMGTGMGIPSMHIYATELCSEYGCEELVRIGTAGGFLPEMRVMDIALSQATSYYSSFNDQWFPGGHYAPCADFGLLMKCWNISQTMEGFKTYVGNTICNDLLYRDPRFFKPELWAEYGIIASEQEAAALYTVAAQHHKKALTLMTISGGPSAKLQGPISAEARERGLDNMITLALRTLCDE